jgi:RimJ/RimL family protein N-acetyltransferase
MLDEQECEPGRERRPSLWPLFGLRLATARLELAPVGDDDLDELTAIARLGIHDPETTPFSNLWTDRTGADFERGVAQYFWSQRAHWSPTAWAVPFAVRWNGVLVGVQQLQSVDFAVLRTVTTSSWLGQSYQGKGIGTEMRAAALSFSFDVLGADVATSGAYDYNPASVRVSEKLGYERNGVRRESVRGKAVEALLFRMTRALWFRRPRPVVLVEGLEPCLELFGAGTREAHLTTVA